MTIKEAAAFLGVSMKWVYALIQKGDLQVAEHRTPLQVTSVSALRYLETRNAPGRPASK